MISYDLFIFNIARTLCRIHCKQTLPSLKPFRFWNVSKSKTCISDRVNCFTVMLSRCSKHSKLPHIFLVMRGVSEKMYWPMHVSTQTSEAGRPNQHCSMCLIWKVRGFDNFLSRVREFKFELMVWNQWWASIINIHPRSNCSVPAVPRSANCSTLQYTEGISSGGCKYTLHSHCTGNLRV